MDYTHDLLRQLTDAELAAPDNAGLLYEICAHEDMAALRYLVEERHLSVEGKSYLVCPVAGWLRIAAMRRGARLGGKRGLPAQQGADMGNGCGLFLLRF